MARFIFLHPNPPPSHTDRSPPPSLQTPAYPAPAGFPLPKSSTPPNSFAKAEPRWLGLYFCTQIPHPHAPIDPRLPALKPQLTLPLLGSRYPNPVPPPIRSRKPSPDGSVYIFAPKSPTLTRR